MEYELREGRLWRDGEPWFAVGVNYHPSSVGTSMWRSFPEPELAADLDAMAAAGLGLVRIFVYWADLEPVAGDHSPMVLERIRHFGELAARRDLGVLVSALTLWMNGRRFYPPWLSGRNLWKDPLARERSRAAVTAIASAAGPTGTVVAYDLGDELPHADHRSFELDRADVVAWQTDLAGAIRATDPGAIVTQANEASAVFACHPFGPDNRAGLDLAAVHGFPLWGPATIGSHRDAAASLLPSFLAAYAKAWGPVLIDEIGTYGAGPHVTSAHLRASLPSVAAAGAAGAVMWSWKDITAPGPPYDTRPTERLTGLIDSSGQPRPALGVVSEFAAEAAELWSRAVRRPASVAIFLTEIERHADDTDVRERASHGVAAFHAYLLCARAHLPVDVTTIPETRHRLIVCPSPSRLTERDLAVLSRSARAGATVLLSVGDPLDGLPGRELSGVEIDDFVPGRRHGQFGFAGHIYRLRWPQGERAAVLRPVGALVVATFDDGSPAVTRYPLGTGEVWLLNAPFERQIEEPDDLARPEWADAYTAIAAAADIVPSVACDSSDVELQSLVVDGEDRILVVNHGWDATELTLSTDGDCAGDAIRIAGKSSLLVDSPATFRSRRTEVLR